MPKRQDPLTGVRIAKPCPASWDRMAGDERVRHCTLCDLNVYNFAAMTREEISELLARTEGRVCGRLYRRTDGTLLTRDCPTALTAARQTLSRWSSATVAALLTAATLLTGCVSTRKARAAREQSKIELAIEQSTTPQQAVFAGVVVDDTNLPLPGVTVVARDAAQQEFTAVTDGNGLFSIGPLADGLYRVEVLLPGYKTALVEHVPLRQSEITRARVSLRIDATTETITVGAIAVDDPAPSSTTFTHEFLTRRPF